MVCETSRNVVWMTIKIEAKALSLNPLAAGDAEMLLYHVLN